MAITTEMIKQLRQETGAGVLQCKKALEQTGGDMEQAAALLREQGMAVAAKKADRITTEGRVEAYVHSGNKLGTLVEVNCETDFVARTERFINLCHELAMQIAATNPQWVSREDIPEAVLEAERQLYRAQMAEENKPEPIMERIIEGKMAKFFQESCLLEQPWIRDENKTIRQLLTEAIAELGENIVIKRFVRFQIE
ncbi:MAG: translation elongation factor Ts [Chloroflexi bacterium]|nr:translation elongation factor Ts [Chloroflexota bacterium]